MCLPWLNCNSINRAKKTKLIFYFVHLHAMNIWTGLLQLIFHTMSSNSFSRCFIELTSHIGWCMIICNAIRCWNIRNSRIFCFWFCIVRACNYKRQNPPTLQKEKKKGTYIWAKVTYIYSKSLAETISLKIVRMQV